MFVAVTVAMAKLQLAPRPPLPPGTGTTGQHQRDLAGSLLWAGARPGPPTATGGPWGTLSVCFLRLHPQPLLSAYPVHCSFIHSGSKYFTEHLLCARHYSGCRSDPKRQNPASVGLTLWGRSFHSEVNRPPSARGCHSLAWQALPS